MSRAIVVAVSVLLAGCTAPNYSKNTGTKQSSSNTTIPAMKDNFYTHALWHIKEGKTEEFIAAWKRFGDALSEVPHSPPVQGTLIQSLSDPLVFYSFGPWETLEDINAMRNNENVKKALSDIMEVCQQAKPGNFKTVLKLAFPGTRKQ